MLTGLSEQEGSTRAALTKVGWRRVKVVLTKVVLTKVLLTKVVLAKVRW
jgi:hypothetical protein